MSMISRPRVIILGAGKPMTGNAPSGLRLVDRQRKVLDWIMHAFRGLDPSFVIVGGYQIDEMIGQIAGDVSLVTNPDWATTGSVGSLFKAGLNDRVDHYLCYGDILFREDLVARLAAIDGVAVAVDGDTWRMRQGSAECVRRIDSRLDFDGVPVEFVGLAKIPGSLVQAVDDLRDDPQLRRHHVSRLIEALQKQGLSIAAVDAHGTWSSLDDGATLARFVLGTKAETLSRLRERLTLWTVSPQLTVTVGEVDRDPLDIADQAADLFPGELLAIRSSALCEDGFETSNAGRFVSLLNVPNNPEGVADALRKVADSYSERRGLDQILVQPMVGDVVASGVALTRSLGSGAPYYTINFSTGPETDGVTSGQDGNSHLVTIFRGADYVPSGVPDFVGLLLRALHELEYVVDYDALDVEFAVDGAGRLHLLQTRPLVLSNDRTQATDGQIERLLTEARQQFLALVAPPVGQQGRRPVWGVMPDWNPAEIIGIRPNPLAFGLYRNLVTDEVWAQQRVEFGYRDVRPTPLVRLFAGHAFVDVRTSFNSFVPAGLPEELAAKLLDHFVDRLRSRPELHDKIEFEIVPTCSFNFEIMRPRLRDEAKLNADELAQYRAELHILTGRAFGSIDEPLGEIRHLARRIDAIDTAAMEPLDRVRTLLYLCRRHGSLAFSHLARHGFIAVTGLRSAVAQGVLENGRLASFMQSLHTVARELTRNAWEVKNGRMAWEAFVETYGHLRPGTYEIMSECYTGRPEGYLRGLVTEARPPEETDFSWTEMEREGLERFLDEAGFDLGLVDFERYLRVAIEGREDSKFVFTRVLSRAIEDIAAWGGAYGLDRSELSHLWLEQLFNVSVGAGAETGVQAHARELSEQNRRWRDLVSQIELPPLLFEEDDLLSFSYPPTLPNFITAKRIVAPLVDLGEGYSRVEASIAGKIVLTPRADPGFDWLFGRRIAGLITIYGGANSHMAIRAAEFGLPAAIGIGEQRYRELVQALVVELDCGSRQICVQR